MPLHGLGGRKVSPLEQQQTKCTCCEHPVVALTSEALHLGMRDHAEYVNATADRLTDPHFEDARMDALITDAR